MKQIFKITFPNNKIFIGKDLTGTLTYFGDFDPARVKDDYKNVKIPYFALKKEILWESETADDAEVSKREAAYIRIFDATNPKIGYNR
ncbi:MAG: GIY-YIG nuclease family protein [Spirochaetales bacterium]